MAINDLAFDEKYSRLVTKSTSTCGQSGYTRAKIK